MAREHARIWLDINGDDDFESLPFDAQGLYCRVILTLDDLNYCGVADWRPRRLTTKAPDLPYERIIDAAAWLEDGRYCLFDLDTEEVLARSFIRRDELLRNPKMAAAVVKAYNGIASKVLRAAVVTEVRRVRDEHPEYTSWAHKDTAGGLSKLMAKPGLDEVPYANQIMGRITNGEAMRIGNPDAVTNTNPETVQNGYHDQSPDSVPIPSTYTSTSTPAPLEGLRNKGTHQSGDTGERPPFPDHCEAHQHEPVPGKCGDCADARRAAKAIQDSLAQAAADERRAITDANRACPDCDPNGLLDVGNGVVKCTHPKLTEAQHV